MKNNNPIIVAMTGASGAVLGYQTIQSLIDQKVKVIFVCSSAARMVWKDENLPSFGETIEKWENTSLFKMYSNNDFYSPIASGTFKTNGMIIVPTSMNTIAAISNGISDNLIKRAADVVIKENRNLILVPRETPLNAIHLNNMAKLANIGVKFIPPNPPYYLAPKSIEEINDFIVNRILLSSEVIDKLPDNYIYNEND